MTKNQRDAKKKKPKRRARHHAGKSLNPFVFPPPGFDGEATLLADISYDPNFDFLANSAGTLLVQHALAGCSFQEKAIIAGLIPLLIPLLRQGGSVNVGQPNDVPQRANAGEPEPAKDSSEEPQQQKP
jgi:hypothetical protein